MVRCKFQCTVKDNYAEGSAIKLIPVFTGSEENEKFFKYTPYGVFEFGTINPDAASQFEIGKEYYIDIAEA